MSLLQVTAPISRLTRASSPLRAPSFWPCSIQSDMKESRESIVEIPDITEECVRAMLKYNYYSDIKSAEELSLVAYEIFSAGHKYDITELDKVVRVLLVSKSNDWYEVEVAVKLFFVARNLIPVDDDLKKKAVQAIQYYALDIEGSATFKELFKKDANVAMELLKYVLSVIRIDYNTLDDNLSLLDSIHKIKLRI